MKLKEAIEQLREGLAGVADPQEVQAMIRVICEDVFNYDPVDVALRQESELPDFAPQRVADIIARNGMSRCNTFWAPRVFTVTVSR